MEGNYEVILDFGVPWCNGENYCWYEREYIDNIDDSRGKHLGIDIKLAKDGSNFCRDEGSSLTHGIYVYPAFSGRAWSFGAGSLDDDSNPLCGTGSCSTGMRSWGDGIIIEHNLDELIGTNVGSAGRFYTIYMHLTKASVFNGQEVSENTLLGQVYNLDNKCVRDLDHLHFSVRFPDPLNSKCGGGRPSLIYSNENTCGKCFNPNILFPGLQKPKFRDTFYGQWWYKALFGTKNKSGLVTDGVIQGYSDGRFGARDPATRAEVLKIAMGAKGIQAPENPPRPDGFYSDVEESHWIYSRLVLAWNNGWVEHEANFRPDVEMKRWEAAKLMVDLEEIDSTAYDFSEALASPFNDVDESSPWFEYVYISKSIGAFKGDQANNFNPESSINRAEISTVLWRVFR